MACSCLSVNLMSGSSPFSYQNLSPSFILETQNLTNISN